MQQEENERLRGLRSRACPVRRGHAFKNGSPVVATQDGLAGAVRMRHQTGHVEPLVGNARDVKQRPVRV